MSKKPTTKEPLIRIRDHSGERTVPLKMSGAALFTDDVIPWRIFRWRRGQKHFSGFYWSSTMQKHVTYESRLELQRLLIADFDPTVIKIHSQPFQLVADCEGRVRRHIPDFLLTHSDASVAVVNVKPEKRLKEAKVSDALAWAESVLAPKGWRHEIWTGDNQIFVENVRFLAGYRRDRMFDDLVLDAVLHCADGQSIGGVESALEWRLAPDLVRPSILHLLWQNRLQTNLTQKLDVDSQLVVAA